MKKIIFSLVAVAAMAFAMVACNNNKTNEEATDTNAVEAVEAAAEEAGIVGTFTHESLGTYEFKADGTATWDGRTFTYTVEGDKLSMINEFMENPMTYTFTFDGKDLMLTNDKSGMANKFVRQ